MCIQCDEFYTSDLREPYIGYGYITHIDKTSLYSCDNFVLIKKLPETFLRIRTLSWIRIQQKIVPLFRSNIL
jgi:hypothetical protein